jgi:hypothetical protein
MDEYIAPTPEFRGPFEYRVEDAAMNEGVYDGRCLNVRISYNDVASYFTNFADHIIGAGEYTGKVYSIWPLGHTAVQHHKERDKHFILSEMAEFLIHAEPCHYPRFLYISDTYMRMARFFVHWMGGEMAHVGMKGSVPNYEYVVSIDEATDRIFSDATQQEIEKLQPLRDLYDEECERRFPGTNSDPRLPINLSLEVPLNDPVRAHPH